jgi:hypothetical protein
MKRIFIGIVAVALAHAIVPPPGHAQTRGMERRQDRRSDRDDARGTRRQGRHAARDAKQDCKDASGNRMSAGISSAA